MESEVRARSNSSRCPRLPRPTNKRASQHQDGPTSQDDRTYFHMMRVSGEPEMTTNKAVGPSGFAGGPEIPGIDELVCSISLYTIGR